MLHRPPAIFIADSVGLDFLNSIARPVDAEIDWLDSGDGFLSWMEQARLAPPTALDALRDQAMPGEMEGVAAQARSLREWFRTFVEAHRGRPLTRAALTDLDPLNRLLERDKTFRQIRFEAASDHGPLSLQVVRRWRSPETLLHAVGESLARFVCEEDFSDVKACEGPSCTLMFADHTRARARRWCSMAICGNRAKQAAFRSRVKAQA